MNLHRFLRSVIVFLAVLFLSDPVIKAVYPQTIDPLLTTEIKLTASDAVAEDLFGISVGISEDTAVVGSFGGPDDFNSVGAAHIFDRNADGPDNWGEVAKLTASDAAIGDTFAKAVAISGDTVIVGASRDADAGTDSGSAYIFQRDAGGANNWGEVAKLTASDAAVGDRFGLAVAISGDTVIVGAFGKSNVGLADGAAYIFQRDAGGVNNWGEVAKLTASDAVAFDNFGISVAITGDTAIVGAPRNDEAADTAGAAYIFQRDAGGANNWGEVTKLTASDAAAGDRFGQGVAISGNTALVAADVKELFIAAGAAYIFERDAGGANNWGEVTKLTASDAAAGDRFGRSVAIDGGTAIVGAFFNDDGGTDSGSAYIFERDAGGANNWGEVTKLTASDAAAGDWFGVAAAISGNTTLVGALNDDDAGTSSGSAYVFELSVPSGVLYGVNSIHNGLSVIDLATGGATFVGPLDPDPNKFVTPVSMAVHPSDGRLFVWNNSNQSDTTGVVLTGVLLTVDRCTGLGSPVDPSIPAQGSPTMSALAFATDGQLFGTGGGNLYGIDPTTGIRTLIGPVTGLSGVPAGLDFDASGTLFALTFSLPQNPPLQVLGTVDTTTGAGTEVAPLDQNVGPIGSIVLAPDGTLIGSGFSATLIDDILFDIGPATGVVSNIRAMSFGDIPQGMGFAPACLTPVAPTVVLYGEVEIGSAANAIVTLTNAGDTDLTVSALSVGSASSDFSITVAPTLPTVLSPTDTLDIEVTFAPSSEGFTSDVLEINHSAGVTKVGLRGEGVLVETPAEQVASILAFTDRSVDEGTLAGDGSGNSGDGRLGALINMIEAAGDLIKDDLMDEACQQLLDAYKRTDGLPNPPDFVTGSAASELAALIQNLRADLGCV